MQTGKILAIDYGLSAIGMAICDESRQFVFGRGVVNPLKGLRKVFDAILKICKDDAIRCIIFGLPLSSEGSETIQTKRIRNFSLKLSKFLAENGMDLPIVFEDESFTSYEADKDLAELGIKGSQRKKMEDELAAVLILKRYLKLI